MTMFLAIAVLGFAPGLFWLRYFWKKDTIKPEPAACIFGLFLAGIVIMIPVGTLEHLPHLPKFWVTIIAAPIIEEFAKFRVVLGAVNSDATFTEPIDGIEYAVAVALGFASIENVFYLREVSSHSGVLLGMFTVRAVLSVPGHALYASIWGSALGWAKVRDRKHSEKLIWHGLLLAMLLHGLFNFCASSTQWLGCVSLLGVAGVAAISWHLVNGRIATALAVSPSEPGCLDFIGTQQSVRVEMQKQVDEEARQEKAKADALQCRCLFCHAVLRPLDDACASCGRPTW